MLLEDFAAPLVRGFRVVVVAADVVGAHRPVVVGVRLVIRNRVELLEHLAPAGGEDPHQQLVLLRIVARRLRERDAVLGLVREAHAIAVGLHAVVPLAEVAGRRGADPRQHAALRIARHDVRADRSLDRAEVMRVMQHARLDAIPFFVVDALGLAPDGISDPGRGQQVAFVGRVDEHLARVRPTAEHGDRADAALVQRDAFGRRAARGQARSDNNSLAPVLRGEGWGEGRSSNRRGCFSAVAKPPIGGGIRRLTFSARRAIQPLVALHGNLVFADEVLEDLLGPRGARRSHIVRWSPSMAGVPWPLLPYSACCCHFQAAGSLIFRVRTGAVSVASNGCNPSAEAPAASDEVFMKVRRLSQWFISQINISRL